jgi:hypothetical protein
MVQDATPPNWSTQRQFLEQYKSPTDPEANWRYPYDESLFDKCCAIQHADSWVGFLEWKDQLDDSWGFRGQRDSSWWLDTYLDRAVKVVFSSANCQGLYHLNRESEQRQLLFRFQQRAGQYIADPPPTDDICSWLALMQHYGVPTRLLDWTRSPYVALYFALQQPAKRGSCALWAIDLDWLEVRGHHLLGSDVPTSVFVDARERAEYLNGVLRGPTDKPVIVQLDPLRASDRMAAQQGFFLCKLYDEPFFWQIVMSMMIHPDVPERAVVKKLILNSECRIGVLRRLREMNVHSASLFPGLDGFAKSLALDLEIKVHDCGERDSKRAANGTRTPRDPKAGSA